MLLKNRENITYSYQCCKKSHLINIQGRARVQFFPEFNPNNMHSSMASDASHNTQHLFIHQLTQVVTHYSISSTQR